jgi:predicted RNase H-like HicB family nuclease
MVKRKVTVVLFHDDEAGGYVAVMPTFPHCTTQGDTVSHALAMAKESLELNLQEPTDWDLFDLDHAYSEHVVVGTVEVDAPERPERFQLEKETAAFDSDDDGDAIKPAVLNSILHQTGIAREEFEQIADETL